MLLYAFQRDIVTFFQQNIGATVFQTQLQILFVLPYQFFFIKIAVIQPLFDGIGMVPDILKMILDISGRQRIKNPPGEISGRINLMEISP